MTRLRENTSIKIRTVDVDNVDTAAAAGKERGGEVKGERSQSIISGDHFGVLYCMQLMTIA